MSKRKYRTVRFQGYWTAEVKDGLFSRWRYIYSSMKGTREDAEEVARQHAAGHYDTKNVVI